VTARSTITAFHKRSARDKQEISGPATWVGRALATVPGCTREPLQLLARPADLDPCFGARSQFACEASRCWSTHPADAPTARSLTNLELGAADRIECCAPASALFGNATVGDQHLDDPTPRRCPSDVRVLFGTFDRICGQ